ncbi:hypothetical protein BDQ12DRAFT_686095 [Crucibulum laeve]|uniref:Uncharacterized protein n=1 Tax=Crucibulum laeve TaxID=68775 RepID=A0A5C3M714_9AGAR|nr:hypothetical protein BDQ12DRAFT_686095 [Crucibulum laeve]
MSFQHFRLGELSLHQPLPPHLAQHQQSLPHPIHHTQPSTSQFSAQISQPFSPAQQKDQSSSSKQPYGSGDTDDGYTLVFANLQAFQDWRNAEEERQMVEFVKGDTHGSKAVPPRFKDHTKLVCARHSRSGRKKYVKKHPERVRKVPSRKLEGVGCPASISYKTYFDSEEVRACYISQHSHEIGLANLPFTRRGRKAAVQQEKERRKSQPPTDEPNGAAVEHSAPPVSSGSSAPGPSSAPQPAPTYPPSVSMLAPLPPPPQPAYTAAPQSFGYPPQQAQYAPAPAPQGFPQERWDNMVTLFNSVRDHARVFEYPLPSVTALETVLIRLYLESPVGLGAQSNSGAIMQNGIRPPQGQGQTLANGKQGTATANGNGATAEESS